MNTFPEVNMVGMEKDRLQGEDTDVESNNCQSYEAKCCDVLLDAGYGKQDVLTHTTYCLLVLVFSGAAHLNFRLSFLQSFSQAAEATPASILVSTIFGNRSVASLRSSQ